MFSGKRQIFVLDQCVNRRSRLSNNLLSWGAAVVQVDEMRDIAVSGGTPSLILVHSAQIDALTEALTKRIAKCPFIAYGDAASPDVVYSSLKKGAAGFMTVTDQGSAIFDSVSVEQSDQLELSIISGEASAYIGQEHIRINNISVNLQGGDCNDLIGPTSLKLSGKFIGVDEFEDLREVYEKSEIRHSSKVLNIDEIDGYEDGSPIKGVLIALPISLGIWGIVLYWLIG